jgi:diacylglycerol kinase family enzyme
VRGLLLDGEPVVLETPLELGIEPGALRVLVPRAPRR